MAKMSGRIEMFNYMCSEVQSGADKTRRDEMRRIVTLLAKTSIVNM